MTMTKQHYEAQYEAAFAIATSLATTGSAEMSQTIRVDIHSLTSLAIELAHHRARVTELLTSNTELLEKARAASGSVAAELLADSKSAEAAWIEDVESLTRQRNMYEDENHGLRRQLLKLSEDNLRLKRELARGNGFVDGEAWGANAALEAAAVLVDTLAGCYGDDIRALKTKNVPSPSADSSAQSTALAQSEQGGSKP